jgi:hypothetical protein
MGLTDTQFRLIKSRAKSRYTELVQQSMNRAPKTANSVNLGRLGDKPERPENLRCIPALPG